MSIIEKLHHPAAASRESKINRTPGVSGGDACIRQTRIAVWGLEEWRRAGLSDSDILAEIEGLTPDDLAAAWEYVAAHPDEIECATRDNEAA
jgi:uncharacterized protein (DUF433 family)